MRWKKWKNDDSDYCLDIFDAILSIREIEGEDVYIAIVIPNPNFKYTRFKKYPYSNSYFSQLINKFKDINQAMHLLYRDRIIPYLEDHIESYNIT